MRERGTRMMKALVYEVYGLPDVLRIAEVEIPIPKSNEVLVMVHAASVNSWDWDLLRGKPYITRIGGLRKPRFRTLGADIAGHVAAVGESVTRFKVGDEVFGDISGSGWGGFAELVSVREDTLTPKPEGLSFEEAAAIPQAAVLALQGLRDKGKLRQGHRLLINGSGGGVGTFAIQYAKLLGAEVTGVDSAEKLDVMRAVGADHVLDYAKVDFARNGLQYDVILDVVGNRSIHAVKRAVQAGGTYVMVGGTIPRLLQALLLSPFIHLFEKKKMSILVHKPNHDDQLVWKSLVEEARLKPIIDRRYALDDAAQAIRLLGEGKVKGKVVVYMEPAMT
ncbi:Alcohol dehydrogenase zinc-binding domain protein [Paenibacillus curdlanolyticus YK9]|uniref:Alcohol dehydrogenase zinc-binding domain protein n=1 Tax=Paenibacillus curdlanolyticus YK9 TaxID=717606 RepID=E0I5E6_9BACL|nr:NAD(P)-dependent alcohol dehydrogenase [Paenibacillus curdlanolyticus]EFM12188.1 Alcohol dehydrogenase zinc-binding domain protein [Paenibacillus curdlanolyticus YK9]